MKRSTLKRRARRKPEAPGADAWKGAQWGFCAVCGTEGWIVKHHVVTEQKLRQIGREDVLYDFRNSFDIGSHTTCPCHGAHHAMYRDGKPWGIPLPLVSDVNVAFAVEVLGGELEAADYFARHYAAELPEAA